MSVYIGIACCLAFAGSIVYIINKVYNAKDFKMIKAARRRPARRTHAAFQPPDGKALLPREPTTAIP